MSKGRFETQKKGSPVIWLILAALGIAAAAALMLLGPAAEEHPAGTAGHAIGHGDTISQTVPAGESDAPIESHPDAQPTKPDSDNPGPTVGSAEPEPPQKSTEPLQTEDSPQPTETQPSQETTQPGTEPPVQIIQKADAEYEKWLAAAMVVCVSMDYPDFQLTGVYAASSTELEDKFSSAGAYIDFTTGNGRKILHARPLEAERTEKGTTDISTEVIGFATFDPVKPESVDLSAMEKLNIEELSELISQSLLVSIYAR